MRKQKKKLEQMKDYVDNSDGLFKEREEIVDKIDKATALEYQLELEKLKENAKETQEAIDDSVQRKGDIIKSIRQKILEKQKIGNDTRDKENGYRDMDETIISLQKQISGKKDQELHLQLKLKTLNELINKNDVKIKHNKENMRELEKEVNHLESQIAEIVEKEELMLKQSESMGKQSLNNEYFEIKAKIYEQTVKMQQELTAQTRALERANMNMMIANSKKEDLARKVKDFEYKQMTNQENQKVEENDINVHKSEFEDLKIKLSENEKMIIQIYENIEAKEKEGLILKGELLALEEDKEVRKEERRIKEALEDLSKYQKGYHGFFYELIHAVQSKYEISIKVALQNVLKLIVVDNIEVAQKVDEFLTEKGLYLDCLILDKIPQDESSIHTKRKKLDGRGHFIAEVVDCEKNIKGLENALKYFCGDKVVCLDSQDGLDNTVYLSKKGFKRVIALDGTSLSNGMYE